MPHLHHADGTDRDSLAASDHRSSRRWCMFADGFILVRLLRISFQAGALLVL